MKELMNWLKEEESGQGMAEYALILALIAVVVMAAFTGVANGINTKLGEVSNKLSGAGE